MKNEKGWYDMEKNTNAIDKIIAELSYRDYEAAKCAMIKKKGKYNKKTGLPNRVESYCLGNDTTEAIDVKKNYLSGELTEEEYKAYCLRYNLLNLQTLSDITTK